MSDDDRSLPEPQGALLSRWSRRKQRSRAESRSDVLAGQDSGEPTSGTEEPPVEPAEQTAEVELPRIEDLDENSDYSAFLNPKISEDLRRVALRKLFRSAIFNVRDGLDDYDEDFTVYEPLGDVVTSDMRYEMRRKAERAKDQLADAAGTEEPGTEEPGAVAEDKDESDAPVEAQSPEPEPTPVQTAQALSAEPEDDVLSPNPWVPKT